MTTRHRCGRTIRRGRWPSWRRSTTSSRCRWRTRAESSWAWSPWTTSWRRCCMAESRAEGRATPSGGVRPLRSGWARLALVASVVVPGIITAIVERIFLAACVFYVAYIVAGFLARPDWGDVARGTLIPTLPFTAPAVTMVVTLVGTTIAPWMQFYLQSAIVEKGVRVEDYPLSR